MDPYAVFGKYLRVDLDGPQDPHICSVSFDSDIMDYICLVDRIENVDRSFGREICFTDEEHWDGYE